MTTCSALLTDFYQLTMAYGYWRLGMAEREAVFYLFYRRYPFQGNYAICCGLDRVIEYLKNWRFSPKDLQYLQTLTDARGKPLFDSDFLSYLETLHFQGSVDAIPEGQLAFAHEPILRVSGPLLSCQIVETALVNAMGFSTLIATKAARVCQAAQGDPVIEFGMRRAQGFDACQMASRAAFIGGCDSVSNTLVGQLYQIPVKGTMAHSWVMAFENEQSAFAHYAEVLADNVVLLVDTYDTLQGVKNAINVGEQLRRRGHDLLGIRLDSGDLYDLSRKARLLLDQAGFENTQIIASGDLDEFIIADLKQRGALIDVWGVGTRMITGWGQPALDVAYKLAAIRDEQGRWQYKIKRSDNPQKTTNPGIQQVRRYQHHNRWVGDVIYDLQLGIENKLILNDRYQDLLQPIFKEGQLIYDQPAVQEIQAFCQIQIKNFLQSQKADYPVILEPRLQALKDELLLMSRRASYENP